MGALVPVIGVLLQSGVVCFSHCDFFRADHPITGAVRIIHWQVGILRHNVHQNAAGIIRFQQQSTHGKPHVQTAPQLRHKCLESAVQFRVADLCCKFRQSQTFQFSCNGSRQPHGAYTLVLPCSLIFVHIFPQLHLLLHVSADKAWYTHCRRNGRCIDHVLSLQSDFPERLPHCCPNKIPGVVHGVVIFLNHCVSLCFSVPAIQPEFPDTVAAALVEL